MGVDVAQEDCIHCAAGDSAPVLKYCGIGAGAALLNGFEEFIGAGAENGLFIGGVGGVVFREESIDNLVVGVVL